MSLLRIGALSALGLSGCLQEGTDVGQADFDDQDLAAVDQTLQSMPPRCGTRTPSESERAQVQQEIDSFLNSRLVTTSNARDRRTAAANTILVHFHVISAGSSASQGNVAESVLDDQINALNTAFGGARGGANTVFRFVKAGVDRRVSSTWFNNIDYGNLSEQYAKQAMHVGGPNVLNLYVANGPDLGFSTFPHEYAAQPWRDGVVINYTTLPGGSAPYNLGFTAVHEVGHWLGLWHVFEGGCTATGDEVSDTPAQRQEIHGCPSSSDSCTGAAFPGVDPVHNYMGYTDDACMTEFTAGQNTRVDGAFVKYRDMLPDDLVLVGAPGWISIPYASAVGNGTFTVTNSFVTDFGTWASRSDAVKLIGDFDNDGRSDIALIGASGWNTIPIAFSNGDGTFRITNRVVTDFPSWATWAGTEKLVGDFNRDGRDDIALTGPSSWYTLPVAFSNGDGTFNVTNLPITNFGAWSSAAGVSRLVGDFDRDGDDDIALVGGAGWTVFPVAFSNGNGTFTVTSRAAGDFHAWARTANVSRLSGDFNGDGRTDLALTGAAGWNTVPVAFSNGDGTFNITNTFVGDFASWSSVAGVSKLVGDFDRDGVADIALTGGATWSSIPLAQSNSDGSFRVANVLFPSFGGWAANAASRLVGDFNRDGYSDVALLGVPGLASIPVALANGSGGFTVVNGANSDFANWSQAGIGATKLIGNVVR